MDINNVFVNAIWLGFPFENCAFPVQSFDCRAATYWVYLFCLGILAIEMSISILSRPERWFTYWHNGMRGKSSQGLSHSIEVMWRRIQRITSIATGFSFGMLASNKMTYLEGSPLRSLYRSGDTRISDPFNHQAGSQSYEEVTQLVSERVEQESLTALWFVSSVTHDFNNFLTASLGEATLALYMTEPESRAYAHLEKMIRSTTRAAELSQQLMNYAGSQKSEVTHLDLNSLLADTLELLKHRLAQKANVDSRLSSKPCSIRANKSQIQRVVMNLLINAYEAIEASPGQISIQTNSHILRMRDVADYLSREPLPPGKYVSL